LHALFVIDIDDLKNINDNFGHAFGDRVIVEISETISSIFRDADIVSRFGGDEFVVFAAHIKDMDFADKKALELCNTLRKSYGESENKQNISASVGVACFPVHGLVYDELFERADESVYKVKEQGKNGYEIYTAKQEK